MSGSGLGFNIAQDDASTWASFDVFSTGKVDDPDHGTVLAADTDTNAGAIWGDSVDDALGQTRETFTGARQAAKMHIGTVHVGLADTVPELQALGSGDGLSPGDIAIVGATGRPWVCASTPTPTSSTWVPGDSGWDLRDYGATAGGADNAAEFADIVADASAAGGVILVPEGSFLVVVTSQIQTAGPLRIMGLGEGSVLDFSGSTVSAFDVRHSVSMSNLRVTGWSASTDNHVLLDITEATTRIETIELSRVRFDDSVDGYVLFCDKQTAGASDTVGLERLVVDGCRFEDIAVGLKLDTYQLNNCRVTRNLFQNIEEIGVWLGRDYAASLSDFEGQGDYIVTANTFKNIGDGTTQTSAERHAVICFGKRAVLYGNTVDHVENDTGNDCEGFYTKCVETVIAANSMRDAGLGQAMIAQKGLPRADSQTPGYNTVIANNVLRASAGVGAVSALSIGVGEAVIEGNTIDGMTDTAVVIGGSGDDDIVDVLFAKNRLVNTDSNIGISLNCAGSRSIKVIGNLIDGVDGGSGNAVGVQVTNADTNAYEQVEFKDNTFRNITSTGGTHVCGILDNMTQNPSVEKFDIIGNRFDGVPHGIKFAAAAPRHLRLQIFDNDFTGCTTEGIDGSANLLTGRTRIRNNAGWITENSGSASFSAASSVVVTHSLNYTKRLERRVILTPAGGSPPNVPYLTAAGATTFTINVGSSWTGTINWQVVPHQEVFA